MIKRVQAGQPVINSAARANEIADKVNSITLRPGVSRGMGTGAVGVVMVENLTADDWRGGQPIRLSGASTSAADIVLTGNSVFVGGYSGHIVAVTARPILTGEIGPAIVTGAAIVTGLPEGYDPAEHFGVDIDEDDGTLTAAASGAVTLIGGVAAVEEDIVLGIPAAPAVAVALLGGGSAPPTAAGYSGYFKVIDVPTSDGSPATQIKIVDGADPGGALCGSTDIKDNIPVATIAKVAQSVVWCVAAYSAGAISISFQCASSHPTGNVGYIPIASIDANGKIRQLWLNNRLVFRGEFLI